MRFAFTEDQLMYRDAVRGMLQKECTPAAVRSAWSSPTGRTETVWNNLVEMGILGASVPEENGGLGLGPVDWIQILEEMGRACLPEPFLEHSLMALPILARAADRTEGWLTRAASGDALVLIALNDDARIAYIDQADAVIAQRAEQLYLVERDHLAIVSHQSVDGSRRLGSIAWETSNGIPLSNGTEATTSLATSFNAGALGTAAQLVGLGQTMLDMAVEYAKVRTQFGKAIGSFQAIQHQLCDALLQLEFARPQVYRAAWSLATGYDEQDVDVSMAKAYASAAAEKVAKVALQVHGAIGYTTEYDLHLWMKRAWCLSRIYGDAGWHRRRIGAELLNQ